MYLHLQVQQPLLDVLVFWLNGVQGRLRGSGFDCRYMHSQFSIRALRTTVSSLATTETLSFPHISSTIVSQESCSNSHYFSLYLCGQLSSWFSGVVVQVGFGFAAFSSHAFLIKRNGKRFQVGKYLRSSSNQELLYLPLESLVKHHH